MYERVLSEVEEDVETTELLSQRKRRPIHPLSKILTQKICNCASY